ncbi:hypothetical protein BJY52DRAFT_1220925 [Lactarius psammicola]|nr:hypothetical protein BJY52DRAFT_1220925 [Lactarius psammicola]
MFSICGARGDLSATPDGPPVDYNSTELADDDVVYYYKPSALISPGAFVFVDHRGLNDRVTTIGSSTSQTKCRPDFRGEVEQRNGSCVATRSADDCNAAHLIPSSKGNNSIPVHPEVSGINAVENGVLLTKTVHSALDRGVVAFIKIPNIDYVTLQQLEKPDDDNPVVLETLTNTGTLRPLTAFIHGAHIDAMFRGTGGSLTPAVILDYMYGVAAYKRRSSKHHLDSVHALLHEPTSNDDNDPPFQGIRRLYFQ